MRAQARTRFIVSSESILGNGVRTHINSKGKTPSTGKILFRGGSNPRRCLKQDSEPNTQPTSYSGNTLPQVGQRAQHATNELFRPHAASSRTASPTHYQRAIPAPRCIKQDSEPNTLPASYSGPTLHQAGQRAQHTTSELFRPHAASSRTASPTHYQRAIPAPRCIKQDSEPNTLPASYSGPASHQSEGPIDRLAAFSEGFTENIS